MPPKKEWTKEDIARVQSAEAKKGDGGIEKGGWVAEAQALTDKREHEREKVEWTKDAAARVQAAGAKKGDGGIKKGSWEAGAQARADKREHEREQGN